MFVYLFRSLEWVASIEHVILCEEHRLVRVVVELHLLLVVDEAVSKGIRLSDSLWWTLVPEWVLKFRDDKRWRNARGWCRESTCGSSRGERWCNLLRSIIAVGSDLNGGSSFCDGGRCRDGGGARFRWCNVAIFIVFNQQLGARWRWVTSIKLANITRQEQRLANRGILQRNKQTKNLISTLLDKFKCLKY